MTQRNSSFKPLPWLLALRPKTLPAALSPVVVGSALAVADGRFRLLPALLCLAGALLLQIGVNLANDYFDFVKGVDTSERLGPVRATASGLISLKSMRIGIGVVLVMAIIDGLYLFKMGGVPVLVIGVAALISLLAYSGGPFPLASHALGDLLVFIFFGPVAVCGTYYVQTLDINWKVFISSLPIACMITAILVVNNYRDMETDRKSSKKTLAVVLGKNGTRIEFLLLLSSAYSVPVLLLLSGETDLWILLSFLSVPLCFFPLKDMLGELPGPALNRTLAGTAGLTLAYSLLFSAGIMMSTIIRLRG